jgi:predicted alpha-1,2-mannosidase
LAFLYGETNVHSSTHTLLFSTEQNNHEKIGYIMNHNKSSWERATFRLNRKPELILLFFMSLMLFTSLQAGPNNIAQFAQATASSSLSNDFEPSKITDGIMHRSNAGEWASQSGMTFWGQIDYPWIQLEWESPQNINKVVLYDRPDENTHIAGGSLLFSDGSKINVLQIPNDGTPKVVKFSSKKVHWIRFDVTDGDGKNLGLSEIEVYPSPEDYQDYISWVDPYIETTRGRYFFFVTGSRPFGMISAAPMTRNKNQYGGGYNYNSMHVLGFPQVHGWMLSGPALMPTTGEVHPSRGEQYWKSKFTHDDEIVQPGYHRLYLQDYHTWVEQTVTDRVSFYRFTYTRDSVSKILLNLGGYVSTATMTDASVTKINASEIEGVVNTTGRLWGGPENVKIFFVVRFDRPFDALDGWAGSDTFTDISNLEGASGSTPRKEKGWSYHDAPTSGVSANYNVKAGEKVQLKFSFSYTSIKNARQNMDKECDHWDFDRVKQDAQDEWNQWLGRIEVKGGTDAQKIKFNTDLWHTLLGRHKLDDISGDYPDYTQGERKGSHTIDAELKIRTLPKNSSGESKYHMYNSDALWLTQWNLNILWGLAWPELLDEFSASLVQYADNGKLLPRGPCAGGYSYIMTGCPATNLIVSAYTKGLLTKTDAGHAFDVMKANHMPGGMMEIDEFYINNGYHPGNAGITLEAAFQDWALAQMAQGLNKNEDADYFLKRSTGWKKLYNNEQKLIFPKDENGNWLHDNPLSGRGWIEANAWQATWSVSHDILGLAALMGGSDTLCQKLNFAFEQAAPQDFVFGYSNGFVSYANQPGCSNAHVFNHAGKPWLSQYWVRRVNEQAYGAITPDKGYGGHDEDQGQMGGVSALMSLGIFSLQGTASLNPAYEITSPVFDEVTIHLDSSYYKGKKFIIKTYHNSKENSFIQKATLNGEPLNQFWFNHSDFANGGILELWLGPKPNKEWGLGSALPRSQALSGETK